MAWLASNNLLPFVIVRYRAGRVGPMGYAFWLLHQSKHALASEKEVLGVIANCEAFAAVGDQPSIELNLSEIGPRQYPCERTLQNVDSLVIQSLETASNSSFFRQEWNDDLSDLKSRLETISAGYEDHRQNPNRGIKVYNDCTREWDNAETK